VDVHAKKKQRETTRITVLKN